MNNVRTVSDTKRAFYSLHTRPINTIYRRVIEELMVEMHLLSVNVDFSYNPIYALGVFTAFERFMQGYQPERDKAPIFNALCQAVESDPQQYRQDAERIAAFAKSLSVQDLIAWASGSTQIDGTHDLQMQVQAITNNPSFKYSRLFAIGVFTLLELADPQLIKDEKQRTEALKQISAALHLSEDKLQKDLDLYRSNLEKMAQALTIMADVLSAEHKKRQQRSQPQGAAVAPPNADEPPQASGSPQDKASSGS
ncbi:MAG: photosystem II biogenesis protein Psp29 [Chroococcidiopsidaceae cyanobacterium CP_BM_RX_35]|nr:photosystem II biogenesis protein Psp29 [Chroococcidiopsidaceae cyanobacterium CP_BM_RX_35]